VSNTPLSGKLDKRVLSKRNEPGRPPRPSSTVTGVAFWFCCSKMAARTLRLFPNGGLEAIVFNEPKLLAGLGEGVEPYINIDDFSFALFNFKIKMLQQNY